MKYKKVVLAGGNGYLGRVFARFYAPLAEEVIVLSRSAKSSQGNVKTVLWDGICTGDWVQTLSGADLLINLCGKSVNCRYTKKSKAEILSSRIIPTELLGTVIAALAQPPKLWINVTSATIYRYAEDHPQDEYSGEQGTGFSVDVCQRWESSFFGTITPRTRKIALRMAIVFGASDGAFPRLLNLVKAGLGGKQGSGQQYFSWIHELDAAKCTEWLLDNEQLEGVFNCASSGAVRNDSVMAAIRKANGVGFGLPAPAWLLSLGAILIGTETELILKSRWVTPQRLLDSGFKFLFPKIEPALADILHINA